MNKTFAELRAVDVTPYVKQRDGVDYLPYTAVVDLLYQNGATHVYWQPMYKENGSTLFMSDQVFTDKSGNTNRCYEVRIQIEVDDDIFTYTYPLTNGINPVKDNSLNQNVTHKAMQRAFVKAIAIRYGLGFSLWAKDEIEETKDDDINKHSIRSIEERVQQAYTRLMKKGMTTKEIAAALHKTEDEVRVLFTFFSQIDRLEQDLLKL